ncbi:MAG: hypothetical protein LBE02_09185 [Spirochaetaceae bacterium]|jgi:hypothetical protein|nr:hypothetical protein [Spirochaetaceae bacterium]
MKLSHTAPGLFFVFFFFGLGAPLFAEPPFLPGALDFPLSFASFRPRLLAEDALLDAPGSQEKPQWAKNLRRAEIVAFGSFPFTVFLTATFVDLYRCASHGWDRRYAPWPVKSAGAVSMTDGELRLMFGIAVSTSLLIALADYCIVRYRRTRAAD